MKLNLITMIFITIYQLPIFLYRYLDNPNLKYEKIKLTMLYKNNSF